MKQTISSHEDSTEKKDIRDATGSPSLFYWQRWDVYEELTLAVMLSS